LIRTSLDPQGPAVDEDIRDLVAGGLHDIAERLSGDAHFQSRVGLIESLEVCETEGLEFVMAQEDLLEAR